MNKNLIEILKIYATQDHTQVNLHLLQQSKDSLIALFNDLLTTYINDKNSSTIREFITVNLSGYSHLSAKLGYDGHKKIGGKIWYCEAKPKSVYAKNDIHGSKTVSAKLNGNGNFSDYKWSRLDKDKAENLNMLVSGFVEGKLLYIFEFPFCTDDFIANLDEQLKKEQIKKKIKDENKQSVGIRSAVFTYREYMNCSTLKIIYLLEKGKLAEYKDYITRDFYQWMLSKTK